MPSSPYETVLPRARVQRIEPSFNNTLCSLEKLSISPLTHALIFSHISDLSSGCIKKETDEASTISSSISILNISFQRFDKNILLVFTFQSHTPSPLPIIANSHFFSLSLSFSWAALSLSLIWLNEAASVPISSLDIIFTPGSGESREKFLTALVRFSMGSTSFFQINHPPPNETINTSRLKKRIISSCFPTIL